MPRLSFTQAVKNLIAMGYDVPPELSKVALGESLKQRGVKQRWECKKCNYIYDSPIRLTEMCCPQNHLMKATWTQIVG